MQFYVFTLLIGACIILSGCPSVLGLRITYNRSEFISPSVYPGALVARVGHNFTLTCEGHTRVNWTYPMYDEDDMEVNEMSTQHIGGGHQGTGSSYSWVATLHVTNAHYMDTGYYHCKSADNDADVATQSQYVYVRDENKLVTDVPPSIKANQNQSAIISCRPTSPDVTVTLDKDSQTLELGNNGNLFVSFDPMVGFTLSNMNLINAGTYACQAHRSDGAEESDVLTDVRVFAKYDLPPPSINGTDFIIQEVEGVKLVLVCTVTTILDAKFSMKWTIPKPEDLGTRIFDENSTSHLVTDSSGWKMMTGRKSLSIRNTTLSDSGVYKCSVTDHTSKSRSTEKLVKIFGANDKFLRLKVRGDKIINTTVGTTMVQWVVSMNAYPIPKLQWYAPNKMPVVENGWKFEVNTSDLGTVLKIKNVAFNDAGEYLLKAEGDLKETLVFNLIVRVAPSISLAIEHEDLFYTFRQTYNLRCEVTAYPAPVITWYFKRCNTPPNCTGSYEPIDKPDIEGEDKLGESKVVSTYYLKAEQSGYVSCHAINSEGEANQTRTFWVSDVHDGFEVLAPKEVVEGDDVILTCGVSKYNYTDNILWYYRPQPVSPQDLLESNGPGYILENKHSAFSHKKLLVLNNIQKARSGVYTCKAVGNEIGDVNKSVKIYVEDLRKPVIHRSPELENDELLVGTGDPAQISCLLDEGRPKPTITWYKDETVIMANTDYELENMNQTLSIKFAKVALEGIYHCKVWNRAGEASKYVTLKLKDKPSPPNAAIIISIVVISLFFLILIIFLLFKIRKAQKLHKELKVIGLDQFDKGAMESINPDLPIDDQAELLPYDKKWEFPREKLKLGKQLGAGAFGVVMKADAVGISDEEDITTVAVKMVKRNADYTYIKALASELKIMVHLGKHLNVVNLLGACTKNLNKRELFVIVEYCRFGNLHNYLLRHRTEFIDQVDPDTGVIDPNLGADIIARHEAMVNKSRIKYAAVFFSRNRSDSDSSSDYLNPISTSGGAIDSETALISMAPTGGGEEGCMASNNSIQPEWRSNYCGDYKGKVRPICTRDLLCWAFQVARGMEYLAGRKVLHGDLAARNILLSDDNIVKICDFGLAKSMYKSDNYKKKGDGPLPVKWMAVESIRDRIFSTQSDVWSFGIVLWEFFSLARTPYPGMEADEKLYNKLVEGYRMDRPEFATKDVYRVMDNCWRAKPTDRPSFGDLSVCLGSMLEDSIRMHYVDLNDPYIGMNTSQWKDTQRSDYLAMMTAPTYDNMVSPGVEGQESGHQYINGYLVPRPSTSASEPESNAGYLCMSPGDKESTIFSPRNADSTVFNFPPPQRRESDALTKPDELKPMLSPTNDYTTPNIALTPVNDLNKEPENNLTRNNEMSGNSLTRPNFAPSFSNPSYLRMGAVSNSTPDTYVNMPQQPPVSLSPPIEGTLSSPDYLSMGHPIKNSFDQIHFTSTKDKEGSVNFSNNDHSV